MSPKKEIQGILNSVNGMNTQAPLGQLVCDEKPNHDASSFQDKSYFHYTKADWRLWAKAWRNSFMSGTFKARTPKKQADAQIVSLLEALLSTLAQQSAQLNIAIYLPIESEVDLNPLFKTCLERGHRLLAPRVVGKAQLGWHVVSQLLEESPEHFQQNRYGIWEPKASLAFFEGLPDVVLVPCLMVDFKGFRLGYGGGFYDAQLKQWQCLATAGEKAVPLSVGVLYQETLIRALPVDDWDFPLDAYVSEAGLNSAL